MPTTGQNILLSVSVLQPVPCQDGGPDTGGTLKIYGESLCKDVPYKTLLLSVRDTAAQVVLEMLEKYGISRGRTDIHQFCVEELDFWPEPVKINRLQLRAVAV